MTDGRTPSGASEKEMSCDATIDRQTDGQTHGQTGRQTYRQPRHALQPGPMPVNQKYASATTLMCFLAIGTAWRPFLFEFVVAKWSAQSTLV